MPGPPSHVGVRAESGIGPRPLAWWIRAVLRLDSAARRCQRLVAILVEEALLAWVDPGQRDALTLHLYEIQPTYFPGGARFRAGLFGWERQAITGGVFPAKGRILVGGAGGGREVLGLTEMGYCVSAFEPAEALVTRARAVVESTGRSRLVRGAYADLVRVAGGLPSPLREAVQPPIDGVILGWTSFSHVLAHEDRLDLLCAVRKLAPTAPVLMSFFGRSGNDIGRTRALLRRVFARLGCRYRARLGDGFMPWAGFYYAMTPEELSLVTDAAGYRIVQSDFQSNAYALLVPTSKAVTGCREHPNKSRLLRLYFDMPPAAFDLQAPFAPAGDQPKAIAELTNGIVRGDRFQTLLGVTGSGKTMTVANVIKNIGKPTLVLSHNKTLAAQLYGELKSFFPQNAVEYFISYYDYYQPEAYVPSSDTYIEKDASINEDIDRLRLRATSSLMERSDVVIVATVSAIYGLGDPVQYKSQMVTLTKGQRIPRDEILRSLVKIQYNRNDVAFERGTFRVRGDTVEIFPAYEEQGVRVEMWGDEVERISKINVLTGETIATLDGTAVYPAKHFVTQRPTLERAVGLIRAELTERLLELKTAGKLLEAQRLESRTNFDIEMMLEIGTCAGIENYSRHLSGRAAGERPACLFDYFPEDFVVVVDESHVTLPQIAGMFNGDRARKLTLVEYGFRLPSALDNRPLMFDEFLSLTPRAMFASATPGELELQLSEGVVVEQIIRPTGLIDPEIEIRPVRGQVDDLLNEIRVRERKGERVLVTTLTKRMSEDLTDYLQQVGVRVRYMHSDIDAIERMEIVRGLRLGEFDVLVGINLLREGLDLPEVSLVAILDADQEGFLRSDRSLIQTVGRAARHVHGRAIFYADRVTGSMQRCLEETGRRRDIQRAHNEEHGITPTTVTKSIDQVRFITRVADARTTERPEARVAEPARGYAVMDTATLEKMLEEQMREAAIAMDFELAAQLRDQLFEVRARASGAPVKGRTAVGASRSGR